MPISLTAGPEEIVVISDLHLAGGDTRDDFDFAVEDQLCGFLTSLSERQDGVELVIAGDFLDFLQSGGPWSGSDGAISLAGTPLCYDEPEARERFRRISVAHRRTFDSLSDFLRSGRHNRLTILPGNHDADLFWESIRTAVLESIGLGPEIASRTTFVLEQEYRPSDFPGIWIEHGHQHDLLNRFVDTEELPRWDPTTPPILPDAEGVERLIECFGTRFVLEWVNLVDRKLPWIDNVRGPIALALAVLRSRRTYGKSIFAKAACNTFYHFLRANLLERTRQTLAISDDQRDCAEISRDLRSLVERSSSEELDALASEHFDSLKCTAFEIRAMAMSTAGLDELSWRIIGAKSASEAPQRSIKSALANENTLSLVGGPIARYDAGTALRYAATEIAERNPDVRSVVMGHTHTPYANTRSTYINLGCWIRYVPAAFHVAEAYLAHPESLPFELNYATRGRAVADPMTLDNWALRKT